jgi:hypothetical protein
MRVNLLSRLSRDQRGFSMWLVMMALFACSLFVAAGFAAANDDLPLSGQTKDRKQAYAAAEAGLNFFLTHLNQDSDYWTYCNNAPPPTPGEQSPINQPWNGAGTDLRIWRNIQGSSARYTLESLPAKGTVCNPADQTSMIDMSTGMFRMRSTGQPYKNGTKRSIVAYFRRQGFLDFLYFTYYEDEDPMALAKASDRSNAQNYCAGKFRSARDAAPVSCPEIQFITGDSVDGPLHTNDSLLICNKPSFGRTTNNRADRIEVVQTKPAALVAAGGCSQSATINGVLKNPASVLDPPASNAALKVVAQNGGNVFTGQTFIRLRGSTMDVTTTNGGVRTFTSGMPLPANGVIYVKNDTTNSCPVQYPTQEDYTEGQYCGNVYVSGTYSQSLTIAAENDVIVAPTDGKTLTWGNAANPFSLTGSNNSVLGLIANNFVRVGHPVKNRTFDSKGNITGCTNQTSAYDDGNVQIQAAILSIDHSFIVDNYNCGNELGTLSVTGAIAQRYRGPVGTSGGGGGTGFLKDYNYDDRLKYRSPPHFLNPVDSAWQIVRENEQVPAR